MTILESCIIDLMQHTRDTAEQNIIIMLSFKLEFEITHNLCSI